MLPGLKTAQSGGGEIPAGGDEAAPENIPRGKPDEARTSNPPDRRDTNGGLWPALT